MEILVFRAGEEKWGVDVQSVVEILDTVTITPLPGLPSWTPGLADHRGQLLPVVDLRLLSGVTPASREAVMIVHTGDSEIAVIVDGVESTRSIDVGAVEFNEERPWTAGLAGDVTLLDPGLVLEAGA